MSTDRGAAASALVALVLLPPPAAGQGLPHQHMRSWQAPAGAEGRKNPVSRTAGSIDAGRQLYTQNCLVCHGAAGKGDGPGMPPLPSLSERDRWNLVNYLRALTGGASG